jgi:transcriptional regulator with XRE-family HTH domain
MGEKVKKMLIALSLTQKEFAESIGIRQSTVAEVLADRSQGFSISVLSKISKIYKINLHWLLTGEGEMFLSDKPETNGINIKNLSGGNIQIGSHNSIHNYPITDEEQAIIDKLRKVKDRKVRSAIRVMLGIENN